MKVTTTFDQIAGEKLAINFDFTYKMLADERIDDVANVSATADTGLAVSDIALDSTGKVVSCMVQADTQGRYLITVTATGTSGQIMKFETEINVL